MLIFLSLFILFLFPINVQANVDKPFLTDCIGDDRFDMMLHLVFLQMEPGNGSRDNIDWEPRMPDLTDYQLTQLDVDKFLRFEKAVITVADQHRSVYKKLPRNNSMVVRTTKAPVTTTTLTPPQPTPSGWSLFSWCTFFLFLFIVFVVGASFGGYYLWRRKNGQNLSLVDLLPLVNNVSSGGN